MKLTMKLNNLFHIFIFFFLVLSSCSQEKPKDSTTNDLLIGLSADSAEVVLSRVPSFIIDEFRADSLDNTQWVNFFAVYKDTSDQEMRDFQAALEGTYTIAVGTVRFKPETEFKSGDNYFARCYTKMLLRRPEDIISTRKIFTTGDFIEFKFNTRK